MTVQVGSPCALLGLMSRQSQSECKCEWLFSERAVRDGVEWKV